MNKKTILIVDDDKKISQLIDFRLKHQGYETHCLYRAAEVVEYAKREAPVMVLLDIRLPDGDGVEILKELQTACPGINVIMISAHADVKVAVDCMKFGAYDFVEKPIELPELDAKVKHVFEQYRLKQEVTFLRRELGEKYKLKSIVGKSPLMRKLFENIDIASRNDVMVLIGGESGTGKELIARAIHFNGPCKEGPFVAVNCGAIPENLLESELFGHEKGAFTGAAARKIGKFEQAQGGTIFLDEIGDLPALLQVKLLRVLQEREIERVGGDKPIPIRVKFLAATNKDLRKKIADGTFREDLFFRLNVFPIQVPPLRERREDIPELLKYFFEKCTENPKTSVRIEEAAFRKLMEYPWPGNIRELENFVERWILIKGGCTEVMTAEDVMFLDLSASVPAPKSGTEPAEAVPLRSTRSAMGAAEKEMLEKALRDSGGNVSKASRLLQVSRDTFYRKMKKYALQV